MLGRSEVLGLPANVGYASLFWDVGTTLPILQKPNVLDLLHWPVGLNNVKPNVIKACWALPKLNPTYIPSLARPYN